MIIDFATMLKTIRESNAGLLDIIQPIIVTVPGNIIDPQFDDNETISEVSQNEYGDREVIPGTATVSDSKEEQKTNKDKDQDPPPLFEDVAPLQYKKGEKEIILRDSTGNTIATMERIDVKPKS
jgi:hypothetical protein